MSLTARLSETRRVGACGSGALVVEKRLWKKAEMVPAIVASDHQTDKALVGI